MSKAMDFIKHARHEETPINILRGLGDRKIGKNTSGGLWKRRERIFDKGAMEKI